MGGLIPAHAGKTVGCLAPSRTSGAHPRSRGENSSRSSIHWIEAGSSPLTRGKHRVPPRVRRRRRLIPAHAGKTSTDSTHSVLSSAHPRSRGENCGLIPGFSAVLGSSPLTRGKPGVSGDGHWFVRLIPAHAGKTVDVAVSFSGSPAHPRSRGENSERSGSQSFFGGSSPLTRGKRTDKSAYLNELRLIPAHAGKTRDRHWTVRSPVAHPRSRGENPISSGGRSWPTGSSPLTRGKPRVRRSRRRAYGLIPAHAGKTHSRRQNALGPRAHPRSRGENLMNPWMRFLPAGSSPLTRGKPCVNSRRRMGLRLIPAHAGKTSLR